MCDTPTSGSFCVAPVGVIWTHGGELPLPVPEAVRHGHESETLDEFHLFSTLLWIEKELKFLKQVINVRILCQIAPSTVILDVTQMPPLTPW